MGSGYFGEVNMGNDQRRSTAAAAARRGRKSGGEKPKQPQRGLGVAQLEKIRLHGEMGCASYHFYPNLSSGDDLRMQTAAASSFSNHSTAQSSSSSSSNYGFHQNFQTGMGEYERGSFRYGDSQPTTASIRWDPSNTFPETQHFGQPHITGHHFNPHVQDSMHKNMNSKYGISDSFGSSSQNSESSETQELDLELRLSI